MNALLIIFGNIFITTVFVIMMVGGFYVLAVELKALFEVDVLWRLKMKVRKWAYAETKEERKTLVRMLRGRKGRGKPNLERLQEVKKRLCHGKNNRKTIQIPKVKVKEKA